MSRLGAEIEWFQDQDRDVAFTCSDILQGTGKMPWFLTPVVGTWFAGRVLSAGILPRCQLKHDVLLEKEDIQVQEVHH